MDYNSGLIVPTYALGTPKRRSAGFKTTGFPNSTSRRRSAGLKTTGLAPSPKRRTAGLKTAGLVKVKILFLFLLLIYNILSSNALFHLDKKERE